jgi:hypothetical protein
VNKIGWNSATPYFDDTIAAAKKVISELVQLVDAEVDEKALLLEIARPLSQHLCDGDWDVQDESDFWDELGPDLCPESYKEYLHWKRVYEFD